MSDTQNAEGRSGLVSRRTIARTAAWSVPAVAVVAAAPAHAASIVDVGAFAVDGNCGALGLGLLNTGLSLTAGPSTALPVGTTVTVAGTGLANIGVFSVVGGTATVDVLSPTSRTFTLTTALAPAATLQLNTTLSVSVAWTLSGAVTLPSGYVGTGAKTTGGTSGTLILCTPS